MYKSLLTLSAILAIAGCKQQIDVVAISTFETHVCAVSVPSASNPNPVQCWGSTNPLPQSPERADELAAFQSSIKNPKAIATTDIGVCVVDDVKEPSRLKCITTDSQPVNILNPTLGVNGSVGEWLGDEIQDIQIAKNGASYTLCSSLYRPNNTASDIGCWPAAKSIGYEKAFRFRSLFSSDYMGVIGSRWPGFPPTYLNSLADVRLDKPSLASGQICLRLSFYDQTLSTRRYNAWCTSLITDANGRFSIDLTGSNTYNVPPIADVIIDTGDVFSVHALSISDRLNKRYCVVRSLGQSICEGRPEIPPFGWIASTGPIHGEPDTSFVSCSYTQCRSADGSEIYPGLVTPQDKTISPISIEKKYACLVLSRDPSKQNAVRAVRCNGELPAPTPDALKG